ELLQLEELQVLERHPDLLELRALLEDHGLPGVADARVRLVPRPFEALVLGIVHHLRVADDAGDARAVLQRRRGVLLEGERQADALAREGDRREPRRAAPGEARYPPHLVRA